MRDDVAAPVSTASRRRPQSELPSHRYYFWLMAPAIIVLACITIYPFFWMIYMGLHDVECGSDKWNDFANFTRLARDAKLSTAGCCCSSTAPCAWSLQVGIGVFARGVAERLALREDPGHHAS